MIERGEGGLSAEEQEALWRAVCDCMTQASLFAAVEAIVARREREAAERLVGEVRAMRPSTDVNRLQLSRPHREDELGKLAYRRAINDVLAHIEARAALASGRVASGADSEEGQR